VSVDTWLDPMETEENPLATQDPRAWELLIESVGPPAMLVRIQSRRGPALLARSSAEDLWQESLRQRHEPS
jgi:hypothetical protein